MVKNKDYVPLKEEFLENPFSILDARTSRWQTRKKEWLSLGLNNEIARDNLRISKGIEKERIISKEYNSKSYVSSFDPYLAELMYTWFGKENGTVLDPFCGGVTRGAVAAKLGLHYTGIDIRPEQIESNIESARRILGDNDTKYICGDSNDALDTINEKYDMVFSCPPYFNLERYSDLDGDVSNMDWDRFKDVYYSIINKACSKLRKGGYAVFVVGDVRARNGAIYGLVPYTIKCFVNSGLMYYNEMILSNPIASAAVRARQGMKYQKIVKIHQNVLVFKKHRVVNVEKERL